MPNEHESSIDALSDRQKTKIGESKPTNLGGGTTTSAISTNRSQLSARPTHFRQIEATIMGIRQDFPIMTNEMLVTIRADRTDRRTGRNPEAWVPSKANVILTNRSQQNAGRTRLRRIEASRPPRPLDRRILGSQQDAPNQMKRSYLSNPQVRLDPVIQTEPRNGKLTRNHPWARVRRDTPDEPQRVLIEPLSMGFTCSPIFVIPLLNMVWTPAGTTGP